MIKTIIIAAIFAFTSVSALAQTSSGGPYKLLLADVVGNSNIDVVLCYWNHGAIWANSGDGDGYFTGNFPKNAVVTPDPMGERHCHNFDLGDIDGDGDLDIIEAIGGLDITHPGTMSIKENTGSGTWDEVKTFSVPSQAKGAKIGDFNNDGDADIAYTARGRNISGDLDEGVLYLCPGNGDFTFGTCNEAETGISAYYVETGDFNEDGYIDFAVPNERADTVEVVISPGATVFTATLSTTILTVPEAPGQSGLWVNDVRAADFTGNGCLDLVTANYTAQGAALFEGNCDGTFEAPTLMWGGDDLVFFAHGDFDGDGDIDLAGTHYLTTDGYLSVFINQGNGKGFFILQSITIPGSSYGVDIGDLDGDSNPDIVVGHYATGVEKMTVLMGNGDGTFDVRPSFNRKIDCTQTSGAVSC
jgi:hypothetical protein